MSSQKHSHKSNGEIEVDLKDQINEEVNNLFKAKPNDFSPSPDWKSPEDLDSLADELFDMLYEHTNK